MNQGLHSSKSPALADLWWKCSAPTPVKCCQGRPERYISHHIISKKNNQTDKISDVFIRPVAENS